MPAFTPNRNYPYSLPTDPADVPISLQDLAEAIDLDLRNVEDQVLARPFAQVSGTTPQKVQPNVSTTMLFDFVDFDNDGMASLSQFPTRLQPQTAGTYWVYVELNCPPQFGSSIDPFQDIFIRVNGVDLSRRTRSEDSGGAPGLIGSVFETASVLTGVTPGTSSITVTFQHNYSIALPVTNRKLGCFRIAN